MCKACKHIIINRHVNKRAWARQHGIALCTVRVQITYIGYFKVAIVQPLALFSGTEVSLTGLY